MMELEPGTLRPMGSSTACLIQNELKLEYENDNENHARDQQVGNKNVRQVNIYSCHLR
jgi:hypothetical protein